MPKVQGTVKLLPSKEDELSCLILIEASRMSSFTRYLHGHSGGFPYKCSPNICKSRTLVSFSLVKLTDMQNAEALNEAEMKLSFMRL